MGTTWTLEAVSDMQLLRDDTLDDVIWESVHLEYPTLPKAFAPGEIVLDIGCHTGAFSDLAARRGATVIAYEANRENHALAELNLAHHPAVTLNHAAIWRSDLATDSTLLFAPHADNANTGGGSVMFDTVEDHWKARPNGSAAAARNDCRLTSHTIEAIPLDQVLADLGNVRFLKIDVEGSEFPILLTATRLDLVHELTGEYHELTDEAMGRLSPSARVGDERYTPDLLRRRFDELGFESRFVPDRDGRGVFSARQADRRIRG
jgi:FkbM family methyltransferase